MYVLDQATCVFKHHAHSLCVLEILSDNTELPHFLQEHSSIMFSNASVDHHEHGKGNHVINSRGITFKCSPPFDDFAGEVIIPISPCFLCVEKKHCVVTNGLESLLLRADRYSRNLNCEIDHNVYRTVTSTRNSIIYQGILRPSETQVAIKSIIRFMPDSDLVKVNSFNDLPSHWLTTHRLANSP